MNFEPALRYELSAVTGLTDKVFPLVAPDKTAVPYLVYESSEGIRVKDLSGYTGLKRVDVELYAVAAAYAKMKSLQYSIISKIIGFQSRVIGTDGPYIQNITYEPPVEIYEPLPKLYRVVINFQVHFEQ